MSNTIPNNKHLTIATRGSQLALWQAEYVSGLLRAQGFSTTLKIVSTVGDRIQDRFLHEIGGKGLFIRELEDVMAKGEADLAVHSLKDLPVKLPDGFQLTAVLKRHSPGDVLVINPNGRLTDLSDFTEIAPSDLAKRSGLKIATSSLRRSGLLKGTIQSVQIEPIRGNVDTRIKKLLASEWDGIVLAEAAFERLQIKNVPFVPMNKEWFIPSASQGALAIETLTNHSCAGQISVLGCPETTTATELEREVLRLLGGDCTMPFGAFAWYQENAWHGSAVIIANDGRDSRAASSWNASRFVMKEAAKDLVKSLEKNRGREILESLNLPWPEHLL